MKPLTSIEYCFLLFFLIFSSFTTLYKLGETPMWDDEAMVSWISDNLTSTNELKAYDNTNTFLFRNGSLVDTNLNYKNLPLDIYYLSIFKRIQKLDDFGERLPFAIAGLLGLFFSFFTIRILVKDKIWLFFSFGLLATSIQFILYNRNCRYYSLEFLLGTILFLSSYYMIVAKKQFLKISYCLLYISSGFLMFLGHFSQSISWIIFILFYYYIIQLVSFRNYKKNTIFIISNLILLALQLSYILIEKPWERTDLINTDNVFLKYLKLSGWLLNDLNRINVIPFIAIIGIAYAYFYNSKKSDLFRQIFKSTILFFGISILLSPQSTSQSVCFDLRYIFIGFILLYVLIGYLFKIVFEKKRIFAVLSVMGFILFQSTNVFSIFPDGNPPRTLLYGFYDGLNNNYTTSFMEVKTYLEHNNPTNKFTISCFPSFYNTCILKYFRNKAILTHELDSNSVLYKKGIVEKYNLDRSLWSYEQPDYVIIYEKNKEEAISKGIKLKEYKRIDTLNVFGNSFDISRPELYWHLFYPNKNFQIKSEAVYIYRKQ